MALEIVPGKPDAEIAAEIRVAFEAKLTEVCKMLDDAERDGFSVQFQTAKGPLGRWIIGALQIAKPY
jgi:hypothetical protein